jgi:hypothetical protein
MTFRGRKHDVLSESRVRENRLPWFDERGVETGQWQMRKSGTVKAKLAETEMPHLLLPRHISTLPGSSFL